MHLSDGANGGKSVNVQPFAVERVGDLRDVVQKVYVETQLGPIEEEILRVVCDRCGHVKMLNMDRFGLDWPDQLEHWRTVEGIGDLCPTCVRDWFRGDDGRT